MAYNPFSPPAVDFSGISRLFDDFEAGRKMAQQNALQGAYSDLAGQLQSGQPIDYKAFAARCCRTRRRPAWSCSSRASARTRARTRSPA